MSSRFGLLALLLAVFSFSFISLLPAEENDDEKEERIVAQIREVAKSSLVQIEVFFRDPRGNISPMMMEHNLVSSWSRYWVSEKPYRNFGVLMGENKILTNDMGILPDIIKSIKVTFFDGQSYQARLDEYVANADAWILGLDGKREKQGPVFNSNYLPSFGDTLYTANLNRIDGSVFQISYRSLKWSHESSSNVYTYQVPYDTLLFNEDGAPIAYTVSNVLRSRKGKTNWVANEFLAGPRMTVEQFRERMKAVASNVGGEVLPIRLDVRGKRAGMDDPMIFGIPVDGNGTILAPCTLNANQIKNIKTIFVKYQGKEYEAEFIGQLKHFSAVLIRLPIISDMAAIIDKSVELDLFKLQFALAPYSIANKPDSVVYPFRLTSIATFWDGSEFMIDQENHGTEFIFSQDGRCIGVYLWQFREWNNGEFNRSGGFRNFGRGFDFYGSQREDADFLMRPVTFAEIFDIAAAPSKHIIPNIAPMSIEEAKKTVWLGVELQELNRNLAEYLDIMEQTKFGRTGARVTWVYAGSPAARAGIKIGDVLLTVKKQNSTSQFEIDGNSIYSSSWWNRFPWPDTRTRLVEQLSQFGIGSTIELGFLQEREKAVVQMELEASPEDFTASPNHKCYELGFRTKNLTYEVRRFFNLPTEKTGVIVYRIESGSKAQVAEMNLYDIIVRVNKQPVTDVKQCESLLLAAIDNDAETVNIEILRLGETRFLEIKKPSKEEIAKIRAEHGPGEEEEEEFNGGDEEDY